MKNSFASLFLSACLVGIVVSECPNACSAHGKCGAYDMCTCYRNWMSNDCSESTIIMNDPVIVVFDCTILIIFGLALSVVPQEFASSALHTWTPRRVIWIPPTELSVDPRPLSFLTRLCIHTVLQSNIRLWVISMAMS